MPCRGTTKITVRGEVILTHMQVVPLQGTELIFTRSEVTDMQPLWGFGKSHGTI